MSQRHRGMKARIARELGISAAAVTKLAKKGMPTDSADAARRWREANLNPLKMAPDPGPSPETLAQRANELARVAAVALAAHRFDMVAGELRAALRAVPESHRAQVSMPVDLWNALIGAHACRVLDDGPRQAPSAMTDEDADYVGRICYALACGEVQVT